MDEYVQAVFPFKCGIPLWRSRALEKRAFSTPLTFGHLHSTVKRQARAYAPLCLYFFLTNFFIFK